MLKEPLLIDVISQRTGRHIDTVKKYINNQISATDRVMRKIVFQLCRKTGLATKSIFTTAGPPEELKTHL